MRPIHWWYILSVLAVPALRVAAQPGDIRLLEANADGAVVEFTPLYFSPEPVLSGGMIFQQYGFLGNSRATGDHPGEPDCPFRSVLLRFPDSLANTVSIVSAEYDDIPDVRLSPVPSLRKGETDPVSVYIPDAKAYGKQELLPRSIVNLSGMNGTGNAVLGELHISPLQYNPASRLLRKYKHIVVRITFGSPAVVDTRSNPLVRGLALNDRVFDLSSASRTLGKPAVLRNSVLSAGVWFRFNITEEGIYKITGQALLDAGIPPTTDPHTIRIYNNGGREPSQLNLVTFDTDLDENAVVVHDEGTPNSLDASDYIVFYGIGTRGWNYSSGTKAFSHYINRFADANVYWLTYGQGVAKQASLLPSPVAANPYRPSTVTGLMFREDERVNVFSTGLDWLGQPFNSGDQITYVQSLPGLDHSQPVTYRMTAGALSTATSVYRVSEHGQSLFQFPVSGVPASDYPPLLTSTSGISRIPDQVPGFSDDQAQIRIEFQTGASDGQGYLDWYELSYRRFPRAVNDRFSFFTQDTTADTRYDISGFSGQGIAVFDVSSPDSILLIQPSELNADTCSFQIALSTGSVHNLWVVGPGGYSIPGALTRSDNQNLHGDTTQVPNIIITHPDFLPAAQRLKAFRELPGPNSLRTLIVDVNQIYNEFGGGLVSPIAIRNYLRYCYENWSTPPRYVLLLGHGDFDYRRIMKEADPNWVPAWETPQAFSQISSYADEGAFGTFNNSHQMNIAIGRLPARSQQDASTMIDKIIDYESSAAGDAWKLRFTFVADDGLQGIDILSGTTLNDGFSHTRDAEAVASTVSPLFEQKKIYLYAYPTEYAPGGRRKPAVNRAIQDQINQGTLVLNFNGHGNPRLWAHEAVFVRETDFPLLHNKGKYFFLVAATCNYANFDNLSDPSGGELLVSMPDAGAIAVFSANRPVYQWWNRTLNILLYQYMMQTDSLGKVPPRRIGDIVYQTKRTGSGYFENDGKYFLLGDPALMMGFSPYVVSIDSVNHLPAQQTASLKALGRASVSASVHDVTMSQPAAYSGTAEVTVFDANRTLTLTDPSQSPPTLSYTVSGNVLFRGESSVTNGLIRTNFIVPRDISYGNDSGKISFFAVNPSGDAAGYTSNVLINGTDSTAPPDVKGPEIRLYLDNRGFRPGDVVSASPVLIADLSDSSGINTSGSGIGHRLEAWLDDNAQSIELSDYYHSKTNTYQEGTVEYPLGSLAQGNHRLRLRAWDTYNNSSVQETVFDVVTPVGMQLTNVFNYPNPFASNTVFTFDHNLVSSIDVDVKIYTVAGRLIQTLHRSNLATRMIRIPWDGRDKDNDPIANGVYLYKVMARTSDGRLTAEALGKLSIVK